jgi:CHAT domain-containing protein/tetratricopeptide (TPR) repeat protein
MVTRAASQEDRELTATIDRLERDGAFAEAIATAQRQLATRERAGLVESALASHERLGELEHLQGRYPEAIAHFEAALRGRRALGGRQELAVASTLVRLGRAEKDRGLYDSAERHHLEALRLARAAGAAGLEVTARALAGYANSIRRKVDERPRAARLLERSLSIELRLHGPDDPGVASARANLALVLLQIGEPRRAHVEAEAALAVQRAMLAPKDPGLALALSLCGWSALLSNRPQDAERDFVEALEIYATLRDGSDPGIHRMRYRSRLSTALAAAWLATGRDLEAWDALEQGLSTKWVEALDHDRNAAWPASPGKTLPAARLARIQSRMPRRAALVGWMDVAINNERPIQSWAFVVRSEGPVHWIRIPLLPCDEAPTVKLPRAEVVSSTLLRAAGWVTRLHSEPRLRGRLHALWEERFRPIESTLDGVDQLVIVDSEGFERIPVECLIDDQGRFLVDRFTISCTPSATVLAMLSLRASARAATPSSGMVLIGAPVSGEPSTTERRMPRSPAMPQASPERASTTSATVAYSRLAGAAAEIGALSSMFSGAVVLEGRDAREAALRDLDRSGALGRAERIHVATHAVGDPRFPDAGALVLAEASSKVEANVHPSSGQAPSDSLADGLWRREEIERLRLGADLVTMSGCMTSAYHTFGGFIGLCDAFLTAGASSVVSSLWPVDDQATNLLMQRFYSELLALNDGNGANRSGAHAQKALALRRAKIWLRDHVDALGHRPFEHPVYWAGFVLIGEPGAPSPIPVAASFDRRSNPRSSQGSHKPMAARSR